MSESGFDRVLIHGNYFPPQSSIIAVLSKIGRGKVNLSDAEIAKAMMLFCELSNTCTQQIYAAFCPDEFLAEYVSDGGNDPEILEYIRVNSKWINLLKIEAELLQQDFHTIVQCLVVIGWYSSIIGDVGVLNTVLIAEEINKMLNVFNRKKPREKYRHSWKLKEPKGHLFDYPDYVWASEYYGDFCSLLLKNIGYKLEKSDSKEIHDGVTLLRKAHIEMSAIDLQRTKLCIPSEPNRLTGFCSNCLTNFEYDRGESGRCQRAQCIGSYNTKKTQKSRNKKKAENKWIDVKVGVCVKCRNIDPIDAKNICSKCHTLK